MDRAVPIGQHPMTLSLIVQLADLHLKLQNLLLPTTHLQLGKGAASDLAAINQELERLREGRQYFMEWVTEFRDQEPAERRGLSPWAFLTAWNDSTARIIYLMRERRSLSGQKATEFDPIMEAVFDQMEQHPGVQALGAMGDPDRAHSDRAGPASPGEGASDQ